MKLKVVMPEDLAQRLRSGQNGIKHLYGFTRIDEGLVQILGFDPQDELLPVAHVCGDRIEVNDFQCAVSFSEIEAIPIHEEFVSRSHGIVDTSVLADRKVALIGVGSVGSQMALHLAQSAVGNFTLLDPDRLSAANLSRHACGIKDLERYKTRAVRDLILNRNPQATVQVFEDDFLALSWDAQRERLEDAHLVIASTDSTPAQFMVNEICHCLKIPSLYIGAYERACAGEVLFVIPGQTPCFNCFMEFRQAYLSDLKKKEQRLPYSDEDVTDFKGEPGLAIDIAYLVAVASAYVLALLDPDSCRRGLLDLERNLTLLHTGSVPQGRYREIFHLPFDLLLAKVKRDKDCPVCQTPLDDKEN